MLKVSDLLRSGQFPEHGIYPLFEMELISGELIADGSEISEVKYSAIADLFVE
jgi:hypothetical protein